MKIVSGGQTGVDRAALDVALELGLECGGWVPRGRRDEVGQIPERYPVRELDATEPADRTRQNVKDSDGTVIIYSGELRGGSAFTLECCAELQRPHLVIDAEKDASKDAAKVVSDFVARERIGTLNVAGPRQSDWLEGYQYGYRMLRFALGK